MRRLRRLEQTLLLGLTLPFIVQCGNSAHTSSSSPPIARTPTSYNAAGTPLAASAFNDSIGVELSLSSLRTRWDYDFAKWSPILMASPIKHVRDGFCNWGTKSDFCTGQWVSRWNQLTSAGITVDVVTDPWMGWNSNCNGTCLADYVTALGISTSSIEAFEGPNECDEANNCKYLGTQSVTADYTVAQWMPVLWTLHSPTIAIYGPAMAFSSHYARFGNLSQYMDYGSIHDYPGDSFPEEGWLETWVSEAANLSGNKPLVSTETNYNTDPTFNNQSVSQLAQERLLPRILFMHLRHGILRTYIFKLFDEGSPGSGFMFGLLNADYTPKPIWTRLMQLMSYFSDAQTSTGTPLTFSMSGDTTGKLYNVLLQRSDGSYELVVWLGTPQWDNANHRDIQPTTETITLALPSTVTSVRVTQFGDNGSTTTTTLPGSNGSFSLPVSSLIEAVRFHT